MSATKLVKNKIRRSPLYRFFKPVYWRYELARWFVRGKTPPLPRLVKQQVVRRYANDYGLNTFIETGTYEGDMVASQLKTFSVIHTIELDPFLCEQAKRRFASQPYVHVHCGDSGAVLPRLVSELTEPALFWLDAHYSGGTTARGELDTPIVGELTTVLECSLEHVVLIDDAREFVGRGGYPLLETIESMVHELKPTYWFDVSDDIIRICPEKSTPSELRGQL